MKDFSTIFKELRLERRMTQAELAGALGVSRSTVGMYESSKRFPDHAGVQRLADYFHVNADYLLGRTDLKYTLDAGKLIPVIEKLNHEGQAELLKYAQLLLDSGNYNIPESND